MKSRELSFLVPFFVVCAGLVQYGQAVTPPPDGGYPGGNTAEGQSALQNLTSGTYNSAIGFLSLLSTTSGQLNTALGAGALLANSGNQNTANGAGALLNNSTGSSNIATGAFALFNNTAGSGNIAVGYQAGFSLTSGNNNIDIGNIGSTAESNTIRIGDPATHVATFLAGITAMSPVAPNQAVLVDTTTGQLGSADVSTFGVVITGPDNTAVGDQALASNTGESNTAAGFQALSSNTDGNENTATGARALFANINGGNNTALGSFALSSNVGGDPTVPKGSFNNAVGANALGFNADGSFNNALGESALVSNIHASSNTAIGDLALGNNDVSGLGQANDNTAVGAEALSQNTDGNSNNAIGFYALGANVGDTNGGGAYNNVIGVEAMATNLNGSGNVAIGDSAGLGVEGSFNIYIGFAAGPSADGSVISEDETIRIGDSFKFACFIGGIAGVPVTGDPVVVAANGKLGILSSSARFKDDIKSMDKASEAILDLKPVTFRYKKEIDSKGSPQFGLVAEEVEKVNPDLVARDKGGKPYSVRYDAVNAMLLNEFLKEHKALIRQQRTVDQQQATITRLEKQIEAFTAGLHKVSEQLELNRAASRTVVNN